MTGEVVRFTGGDRTPARRETGVISRTRKVRAPARAPRPAGPTEEKLAAEGFLEPPIGYVIRFDLRFYDAGNDLAGKRYSYAAIRAGNGRWYTTGSTCPPAGYSWRSLCAWVDGYDAELVGIPALWNGRDTVV